MFSLSRRQFGLGALAAPVAISAAGIPAKAGGHAASTPAVFGAQIGKFRMTAIFDGMAPLQKGMFTHPDPAAIDAALADGGLVGDALPVPVTAFLLQSDDQTILIDAGMGGVEMLGPNLGKVGDGLAAMGVSTEDVDQVIVTHAHPDHIGGLIGPSGPTFQNAEVVVNDTELGFWTDAGIMAQAPEQAKGLFQLASQVFAAYGDRVRPVASGTDVASGIKLELAPGHTPGHSLVHIDGGDRELLMVADLLHSSVLHTALPEVGFGFDTDSALAAETRRKTFDRVAEDNVLIAATHVPFPGLGRFVRSGEAYSYVPVSLL